MKQITFTKMRKFLLFAALGLFNITMSAHDKEDPAEYRGLSIGGSVDTYFRANFNGLNKFVYSTDGETELAGPQTPATAFANDPGYSLGMANVVFDYEGEK